MKELKVSFLSAGRYGKSLEQVNRMLLAFDPAIHDKIKISIVACEEIEQLKRENKLLRECAEFYGDAKTYEKQNQVNYTILPTGDREQFGFLNIGGKKARQTLAQLSTEKRR